MELFQNVHLWAAVAGWFGAELIKIVITLITEHKFRPSLLVAPGGMPSSHSSVVSALCTTLALTEGMKSPLFALSCIFAYVVMYDAAGVRRAAGEQAKVLNRLQTHVGKQQDKYLKELIGHTPLQVICGCLLGIAVGFGVWFLFGAIMPYAA